MKTTLRIINIILLSLFVGMVVYGLSFGACSGSSPSWTSTPDQASVQSCVTQATRGDTITISAGTATWAAPVVSTKALTIQGAGATSGNAITSGLITGGYTNQIAMIKFTLGDGDSATTTRITGLYLNCKDAGGSTSAYYSPGLHIIGNQTTINNVRIDNNYFYNSRRTTGDGWTMILRYYLKGVVDNNTIMPPAGTDSGIHVSGKVLDIGIPDRWATTSGPYASWNNGSEYNIFIEDNTIYSKSGSQILSAGNGGSFVARYNDIDYSGSTSSWYYTNDTHGKQTTRYSAAFGAELYGNKIIHSSSASSYEFGEYRGGKHKVFYNYVDTTTLGTINIWAAYPDTYDYSGGFSVLNLSVCPTGDYATYKVCDYIGNHQLPNGHFWNNRYGSTLLKYETRRGSPWSTSTSSCGPYPCADKDYMNNRSPLDTVETVKDTHFWIDNVTWTAATVTNDTTHGYVYKTYTVSNGTYANDGTSGVGCGTLANRPATCTVGVGYWATNQSCTTVPSSLYGRNHTDTIQGTLYTCTATNTWTATYTPYEYPHPLRDEVDTTPPVVNEASVYPYGQQACSGESANFDLGFSMTEASGTIVAKCCLASGSCNATTTYANMTKTMTIENGLDAYVNDDWACGADYTVYCRAQDTTGNESATVTINFQTEANEDTTPPTLHTVTAPSIGINGRTLTIPFNEAVKYGAGGSGGWTFTDDGGSVGLTYISGTDSTALVYQTASCVAAESVLTLDFAQPGNGIEDQAGNDFATIGDAVVVTNNSTQTCGAAATYSLFDHSDTPSLTETTDVPSNLGVRFKSSVAGTLTHVWFYKSEAMTGTHVGSVWDASGTLLGQVTFTGEYASGWQSMALGTAVDILADTYYTVSVHIPTAAFVKTNNYFASSYSTGNLTAGTENGRFKDSVTTAFPSSASSSDSNFWIDFTMSYAGESGPWQVTVSKTGIGCVASDSVLVANTETAQATITVNNGWAVSIGGDCTTGSGILSGNTYTYTTGEITEDCEVAVTCSEINLVPWVAP